MKIKRIMYVSHRYHTNQIPVMQGWSEAGVRVKFLAQYQGAGEVHDYVEYHRLQSSLLFKIYLKIIKLYCKPNVIEKKIITNFVPNLYDVYKQIKEFKPELLIFRDYNKCNLFISLVCKLLRFRNVVCYTQLPLYGVNTSQKMMDKVLTKIFTNICFTPVKYFGGMPKELKISHRWNSPRYFVPLIDRPSATSNRSYCKNGIINLLDVGKYRDYKNHFFLVKAISELNNIEKFRLKIVGQVSQQDEQDYYTKLQNYVTDLGLHEYIKVLTNIPYREMEDLYNETDILILASKKEVASIAIIEAMSRGICVMSTINNGTACYLENNCGFVFNTETTYEIVSQLNMIAQNEGIVEEKGNNARNAVSEKYTFANYVEHLNAITVKEFGFNIQ